MENNRAKEGNFTAVGASPASLGLTQSPALVPHRDRRDTPHDTKVSFVPHPPLFPRVKSCDACLTITTAAQSAKTDFRGALGVDFFGLHPLTTYISRDDIFLPPQPTPPPRTLTRAARQDDTCAPHADFAPLCVSGSLLVRFWRRFPRHRAHGSIFSFFLCPPSF